MDSYITDSRDDTEIDVSDHAHTEFLVLYRESTDAVRFAKMQQWKLLAYITSAFVILVVAAETGVAPKHLAPSMVIISFVMAAASISTLVIFQMWQSTEHQKLDFIAEHMSETFRQTRAQKSSMEANIHRYALLTFMMLFIVAASGFTYLIMAKHIQV